MGTVVRAPMVARYFLGFDAVRFAEVEPSEDGRTVAVGELSDGRAYRFAAGGGSATMTVAAGAGEPELGLVVGAQEVYGGVDGTIGATCAMGLMLDRMGLLSPSPVPGSRLGRTDSVLCYVVTSPADVPDRIVPGLMVGCLCGYEREIGQPCGMPCL